MTAQTTNEPDLLRVLFDAIPSFAFVVDANVRIIECNAAAATLLENGDASFLRRRGGDVLNCLHAVETGCGDGPMCEECVVRRSAEEASQGRRIARRRTRLELVRDGRTVEMYALVTASPFTWQGTPLVLLIIEDITATVALERLVSICSNCRRVRTRENQWILAEAYFKKHLDIDFSHGLCPECYQAAKNAVVRRRADAGLGRGLATASAPTT